MKISGSLVLIMLLLNASSVELVTPSKIVDETEAIRLPEHTCSKTFSSRRRCVLKKCNHRCSKEPYGMGKCIGNFCMCSYFCNQPP